MTRRNRRKHQRPALIAVFALVIALTSGCWRDGGGGGGGTQVTKAPTPVLSQFEKDLAYVRKAQLAYIYVIARKDGAPFDAADKEYLGRNTLPETSYRLLTDEDRRAIISSNFDLTPENKEALAKRFTFEKI